MKAYLFIETGEIRPVKTEEWYLSDSTIRRAFNNNITIKDVILSRHVIDIPDGTTTFVAFASDAPIGAFIPGTAVPIPRPKKKVKKWKWIAKKDGGEIFLSTGYYENGVDFRICYPLGTIPLYPIHETEIEVEE